MARAIRLARAGLYTTHPNPRVGCVLVGPEGVIATPDITYYASPHPLTGETRETPYISAHFLLKGCKDHETLWHELKMTDFEKVKRGAKVRPVWNEKRVGAITDIKYFEIIE